MILFESIKGAITLNDNSSIKNLFHIPKRSTNIICVQEEESQILNNKLFINIKKFNPYFCKKLRTFYKI